MRSQMPGRITQQGSSFEYVRLRVPVKVQKVLQGRKIIIPLPAVPDDPAYFAPCLFGTHIKATLRTRSPEYADIRRAAFISYLKRFYLTVILPPKILSQRQIVALAGEIYQRMIDLNEENPGSVDNWIAVKGIGRAVSEGRYAFPDDFNFMNGVERDQKMAQAVFGDDITKGINSLPRSSQVGAGMERRYGAVTTWILQEHSLSITPETREQLLSVVHGAVTDAAVQLKKNAGGDYTPDMSANKYPKLVLKKAPYTLSMLFHKWQTDGGGKAAKSIANVKAVVASFERVAGHKDLSDIDKNDGMRWRDLLIAEAAKEGDGPKSLRTINDNYLTMMRSLFNLAKRDDLRLGENPFKDVRMRVPKSSRPKMKRYEDDEIREILRIARLQNDPARRWLPFLAACTGCRIGELCQMYKQSVHFATSEDSTSYIEIRKDPDGGSLKNDLSPRLIPIHPFLIKEGFLSFVASRDEGPLFYEPGRKTKRNSAASLITTAIGHWIRSLGFTDRFKAPNHAFRLWWRTAASSVNMQIDTIRYLFGHEIGSVEQGYIDLSPEQTIVEISKIKVPAPV